VTVNWQQIGMQLLRDALVPLVQMLGATLLQTPHLEQDPTVQRLWAISLGIAGALLTLAVTWLGISVMLRGALPWLPTWDHVVARILVACVQAIASSFLIGRLIDLSNALSAALILSGTGGLSSAAGGVTNQASPTVALLLLALLVVVAVVLLLVLAVVRVLVLAAATALAPLALLAYSVPALEGLAAGWWRLVAASLALPVVDAAVLSIGVELFSGKAQGFLNFPGSQAVEQAVALLGLLTVLIGIPLMAAANVAFPARRSLAGAAIAGVTGR
jgi:hypothetical protein